MYEESIGKTRERLGKGMRKVSDKYAKGIRCLGVHTFREKKKDLTP